MSLVLTLALVLSMCTVIFAEEQQDTESYTDSWTFELGVEYKVVNENTYPPGENFYFTIPECVAVSDAKEGVTVENAPKFKDVYPAGCPGGNVTESKGKATLVLPSFDSVGVGVYTYQTKIKAGKTPGITYDDEVYTFTVTVINDGNGGFIRIPSTLKKSDGTKTDAAVNTYSAGSLSVKKEVKGNMGDTSKEFNVTVTLKSSEKLMQNIGYYIGTKTYVIDSYYDWKDGVATVNFTIKDGETVTFENIPYGVTYTVEEDSYESAGYDAAAYDENQSGMINSPSVSTTITNTKNGDVDTGINLDSVPYIVMLTAVCASMLVFVARKRMARED